MGLLDSNKLNIQQKSGTFSCDLTSSAGQNRTQFNGATYRLLSMVVSGIGSGANVIIVVNGAVADASYTQLQAYNKGGQPVAITANGTYYVDVTGLTEVVWTLTRRAASGTASINWSLSNSDNHFITNNTIDNINKNVSYIPNPKVLNDGLKTYSVDTVQNLETFENDAKCGCFVINVETLASGAALYVMDNKNRGILLYNRNGKISYNINSVDIYYAEVNIAIPSVTLRCSAAVNGTAEIRTGWVENIPLGITGIKPVQLIKSFELDIPSTNEFTAISQNDSVVSSFLRNFKYYFYSYYIANSGGSATSKICHISVQPYYDYSVGKKAGKTDELSVYSGYSYQSEWQEVRSETIRMYAQCESRNEGDKLYINLYGVR